MECHVTEGAAKRWQQRRHDASRERRDHRDPQVRAIEPGTGFESVADVNIEGGEIQIRDKSGRVITLKASRPL